MFSARQFPLLTVFLVVALATPGLAAAEAPLAEAPEVAAAATTAAVEAAPEATTSTPSAEATSEAAPTPAPAEAVAPPPPPTPQPQETVAPETVEETTAAVSSAAEPDLPSEPQQLTDATQEKVAEVTARAAGKGEATLDAAANTVQDIAPQPENLAQPVDPARTVRDVVSTVLDPTEDFLLPLGQVGASSSDLATGNSTSPENRPPLSPPASGTAKHPHLSLAPATTFLFPPPAEPVIEAPVTSTAHDEVEHSISGHAGVSLYAPAASLSPPQAAVGSVNSAGNPPPAVPSPPGPSLPDALDAVTTAPGGTGAVLLLALLALSLLLAPTFASQLRMHAGNCRPAPFVCLLERPG